MSVLYSHYDHYGHCALGNHGCPKNFFISSQDMTDWDKYNDLNIGANGWTDLSTLYGNRQLKRVLELGCGRGKILRNFPAAERYGIDPSVSAIKEAKSNDAQGEYFVGSATKLPFEDNSFSYVYSIEVIEHIKDYDDMLHEAYRVLEPGGKVYIQTPNYPAKRLYDLIYFCFGRRHTWRDDYTHVSKFTARTLKRAVRTYFIVDKSYARNIIGDERIPLLKKFRHSSVARIIGQKTIIVGHK